LEITKALSQVPAAGSLHNIKSYFCNQQTKESQEDVNKTIKMIKYFTTHQHAVDGIFNSEAIQIVKLVYPKFLNIDTEIIDLYQYATFDVYGITICAPIKNVIDNSY
jgi:hypothetical protein